VNESIIQPGDSQEMKANRNLAIGVGVLGLGFFGLFYLLFFAVMFLRPGLIFKLVPVPAITDMAISDGIRTFLVQQKIDMSTIDPRQKREPETRHSIAVLVGAEPGTPQEIPPYDHASGANNRLLFLNTGSYRIYDGSRWVEERSAAIGKSSRGLLAPAGLYVLSENGSSPHLSYIASGTSVETPLPEEFLTWYKNNRCPCAKLAWYQGRLCLFWTEKDSISWSMLDGERWSPAATSPYSGGYDVVSDDRNLYLFNQEGNGLDRHLSYYTYSNDTWTGPVRLPVQGGFMNWNAFIQQGKLKFFVQQFTTRTLYTIENGALVDPVRLKGPFNPLRMMGRMALATAVSYLLSLLVVFGVSVGIRRFKKRIWSEDGVEFEFASLFRRFIASMVDKLVLLIPPAIAVAFFMPGMDDLTVNPIRFMLTIFSATALFFVGGFLYHSLLEGLYGQTLGKKICGIRVLKADFSPCGLSSGFLRNLLRIADAFFYYLVAVIALAGTFKWQRIGDIVAETVVVKENR
jgi:uncharacterized RDD family membrane protein YckC